MFSKPLVHFNFMLIDAYYPTRPNVQPVGIHPGIEGVLLLNGLNIVRTKVEYYCMSGFDAILPIPMLFIVQYIAISN